MYNVYNALAATAVAEHYNISPDNIRKGLAYDEKVFGRQEVIHIDDKECTLVLVKNPVGLNQVIETMKLSPFQFSMAALLNDNYADGIDVSWIWDSQMEDLGELDIPLVMTGGMRHKDMTLRLEVAGIDPEKLVEKQTMAEVIEGIKQAPTKHVYILATYTAVLSLRKELIQAGYIKEEN